MTPRQRAFAQQYAACHNGAAAAIRAGYAAKAARQTASELLTNPNIRALVAEHEAAAAKRLAVSRERVMAELEGAIDVARKQGNPMAMIAGWREIARICGYYAPERAVKVDVNIAAKRTIGQLEVMSDAELLAMVATDAEQ